VAPLTRLFCKDQFQWSDEAQAAFDAMKAAMTNTLILALADFNNPFFLEIDASGSGMGIVLSQ